MPRIHIEELVNRHLDMPAVICGHGPSLNDNKNKILDLQKNKKLIRFCVNDWMNVFDEYPDYWCISNPEFQMINWINKFNSYNVFLLFAVSCGESFGLNAIEKLLKCSYTLFDQRHFEEHDCSTIVENIKVHSKLYGNNETIGVSPKGRESELGFDITGKCCKNKIIPTIQEMLLMTSGYDSHYSTGDTVALHSIAFALIMGCNPIYISGVDLDYKLGYAYEAEPNYYGINVDGSSPTILNDLEIINESAKNMGIDIIDLNKNSWHKKFQVGEFNK